MSSGPRRDRRGRAHPDHARGRPGSAGAGGGVRPGRVVRPGVGDLGGAARAVPRRGGWQGGRVPACPARVGIRLSRAGGYPPVPRGGRCDIAVDRVASATACTSAAADPRRGRLRTRSPPPLCDLTDTETGERIDGLSTAGWKQSQRGVRAPERRGRVPGRLGRPCGGDTPCASTRDAGVRSAHLWRNRRDRTPAEFRSHNSCRATVNPSRPAEHTSRPSESARSTRCSAKASTCSNVPVNST